MKDVTVTDKTSPARIHSVISRMEARITRAAELDRTDRVLRHEDRLSYVLHLAALHRVLDGDDEGGGVVEPE